MADLRLGATDIKKIYRGDTESKKLYLGAELIWTAITSSDFDLDSANGVPIGITWDGIYFRVLNRSDYNIYTYDSAGAYQSAQDLDLGSFVQNATNLEWDGTYFRVLDRLPRRVLTYDASGIYSPAQSFTMSDSNGNPYGITWDGTYFRVTDFTDDKVYTYNAAGIYQSAQDFDLDSENGSPNGIAWDGTYYRVAELHRRQGLHVQRLWRVSVRAGFQPDGWQTTDARGIDLGRDILSGLSTSRPQTTRCSPTIRERRLRGRYAMTYRPQSRDYSSQMVLNELANTRLLSAP